MGNRLQTNEYITVPTREHALASDPRNMSKKQIPGKRLDITRLLVHASINTNKRLPGTYHSIGYSYTKQPGVLGGRRSVRSAQ